MPRQERKGWDPKSSRHLTAADLHQKLSQHVVTRGRRRTESSSITFLWSQESWERGVRLRQTGRRGRKGNENFKQGTDNSKAGSRTWQRKPKT